MEYGIFNDEGCLEDGFYSYEEAEDACRAYTPDDVRVYEICSDHPEQPRDGCEECDACEVCHGTGVVMDPNDNDEEVPCPECASEDMTEGDEPEVTTKKKRNMSGKDSGFSCLECGYKFKTLKAAERASFGPNGCPKCGGADIDLTPTQQKPDSISGENNPFYKNPKNEEHDIRPDAPPAASHDDIKKIVAAVKRGVPVDRLASSQAAKRMGITADDIHEFMATDKAGELDEAKQVNESAVKVQEFDKYMDDILTREALVKKHREEQQNAPETAQRAYNRRYGELPQNRIRYGGTK